MAGRIVETEAYVVGDSAAHSFRGRTPRNASLFAARGHAYVYLSYGVHFCFNVSGGEEGAGEGVLIRALEPVAGIEAMRRNRGLGDDAGLSAVASGPGRLSKAMAIDRRLDGIDLCRRGALWLAHGPAPEEIGVSVRIGISTAVDAPLRFYERRNPLVSGPRSLSP
jgi:DNA-3-methyladenine glycosylase